MEEGGEKGIAPFEFVHRGVIEGRLVGFSVDGGREAEVGEKERAHCRGAVDVEGVGEHLDEPRLARGYVGFEFLAGLLAEAGIDLNPPEHHADDLGGEAVDLEAVLRG